jgi:hypothetical protein
MRRNSESGDLSRKFPNRSSTGPSRVSCARGDVPVVAELAVQVEGQAPIERRVEVDGRVCALEQFGRAAGAALRQGEIREAHVEGVGALELEVAQVQVAVPLLVQHCDFHRVRPCWQDLLRGEVTGGVDRHFAAGDPDRVLGRYAAALDLDRAAAEGNVPEREPALAVGGEQLALLGPGRRRPVACRRRARALACRYRLALGRAV